MGFEISVGKLVAGSAFKLLGREVAIMRKSISIAAPWQKLLRIKTLIGSVRKLGAWNISYKLLSELVGRVGHVVTICKERSAKRVLSPFFSMLNREEFVQKRDGAIAAGFDIDKQLRVLAELVETIRPFVLNLQCLAKKPVRVWTDADDELDEEENCVAGHVGGLLEVGDRFYYFYERLPDWFVRLSVARAERNPRRKNHDKPVKMIGLFETVAVTFASKVLASLTHSCFVDFFTDNKTAYYSGISAWSRNADVADWCHCTHLRLAGSDLCSVWFYISTHFDIADGSTREEFIPHLLKKLGGMGAERRRVDLMDVAPRGVAPGTVF
jgi:hypothetical protein